MRVAVIGAGMGGLVLAQALARAGDDVTVWDRDSGPRQTGGYRLHLNARACSALRRHLDPSLFRAIQASAAGPRAFSRFAVTDHRLRPLVLEPQDPADEVLMIGRVQLRTLLCHGLGDRVRFGQELVGFSHRPGGEVEARFADGSTVTADVLVGADGVGSRVASALAGRATSHRVGLGGIAGRTALTDSTRRLVPDVLAHGPALAVGPGGVAMFLTLHDPAGGSALDAATCGDVPAELEPATLVWGVLATDRRFPAGVDRLERDRLAPAAEAMLRGWAPDVRRLVADSDSGSAAFFSFHAADPAAALTPWPAGAVTALGDAVHAMPPTGGQSAATAIRDADVLARHLDGARSGRVGLATAVSGFHTEMAGYAAQAVRESLQPVRWIRALDGPVAALAARAALPAAAAVSAAARGIRVRATGSAVAA